MEKENLDSKLLCKEKVNYKKLEKTIKKDKSSLEKWMENKRHLDFHKYGRKSK